MCIDEGDFARARELLTKNLGLRWEHSDGQVFYDVQLLGMLAAAEGAHVRAARVLGASERLREEVGFALTPVMKAELEKIREQVQNIE